jgi:hypothetical protein
MRLRDVPQFQPRYAWPYRAHARYTPVNRALASRRTSTARWPTGAQPRRSPLTAPWSTPGRIPHVEDEGAWPVVWFVVRLGSRRHGLMHHLLDRAVAYAHTNERCRAGKLPGRPGSEHIDQTSGYVARSGVRGTRIQARQPDRRQAPAGSSAASFPDRPDDYAGQAGSYRRPPLKAKPMPVVCLRHDGTFPQRRLVNPAHDVSAEAS